MNLLNWNWIYNVLNKDFDKNHEKKQAKVQTFQFQRCFSSFHDGEKKEFFEEW